MMILLLVLLLIALALTLGAATDRVPLWAAVFVLIVANLLAFWGR